MFTSPEKIVDVLDIRPAMAVADFGCGSGHYSVEIAKRVGKAGKVYAVDIQKEALSQVRSLANLEHLVNIEFIRTNLETPNATRLKDDSVDLVIVSNILFQAENKDQVVKEAFRILKKEGRVVAIEWDKNDGPQNGFGPRKEARVAVDIAKDIFNKAGFSFEKKIDPGDHHYGLIFKK